MVLMTSQQTPDPLMRLQSVEEHAKKAIAVTERAVVTPAVCDVSTPPAGLAGPENISPQLAALPFMTPAGFQIPVALGSGAPLPIHRPPPAFSAAPPPGEEGGDTGGGAACPPPPAQAAPAEPAAPPQEGGGDTPPAQPASPEEDARLAAARVAQEKKRAEAAVVKATKANMRATELAEKALAKAAEKAEKAARRDAEKLAKKAEAAAGKLAKKAAAAAGKAAQGGAHAPCEYEKARAATVARNQEVLQQLGLGKVRALAFSLSSRALAHRLDPFLPILLGANRSHPPHPCICLAGGGPPSAWVLGRQGCPHQARRTP